MPDPPRVALTFDVEHPDQPAPPGGETAILAALEAAGARATFFLQGRWVSAHPRLARRIADAGHLVGNHSHYHVRMPLLSRAGMRRDVREAEAVIRAATGADPRPHFRCPFGAGARSARVLQTLADCGYHDHHWNVDPEDWNPRVGAAEVEEVVVAGVLAAGEDAVVLLHGWPLATRRALPRLLERLAGAGARFVTVDEVGRG
jgi:peptidoglycan-N-acetylglucosamine deacetylase